MKPHTITLALFEMSLLALTVSGTALLWAHSLHFSSTESTAYVSHAVIPVFLFLVSSYYNGLYDLPILSNFDAFGVRLPQTLGMTFVFVAILYAFAPHCGLLSSPFPAGLWGLLIIVGMVAPLRLVLCLILKSHAFAERILIVGVNTLAQTIAAQLAAYSPIASTIIGFVSDVDEQSETSSADRPALSAPVLGSLMQFSRIVAETRPDRIIVALTAQHDHLPARELIEARMAGIAVDDGIEVEEHLSGKLAVEYLTPSWLLFCKDFRATRWQMAWRRALSLAVALIGLLLTLPLMALIAIGVKLESPGPVFFLQERAGLHGKTFRLVKFRTMRPAPAAADAASSVWSRDDSRRVTRLGKWLRKLRLDELPQFINILRGDMDLIGPRPEIADNIATMMEQIPYYSLRMTIRPGITGWAQVKHGYAVSQADVMEKLRYDLYYVKHMSAWLDLRIMLDTVKVLLCSPGSQAHGDQQRPPSYAAPQRAVA
jgi:exopolysaccharide biosynthesis polyprenyl glycosylphosphotransferase